MGIATIFKPLLCSQGKILYITYWVNGGHFEIQDGDSTKSITIIVLVSFESLGSQTWVLPPFSNLYHAQKARYRTLYIGKMAAILKFKFEGEDDLEKNGT